MSMKLSKRYGTHINIYFAEDEDPLSWATFAAFTSRNNGPFEDLLDKVNANSKKRVIEQFYIGYSHASIGDLVDVKMFLENIPIWLAFELEGFSRFRGQESSTRYIDFANQPLIPYYAEHKVWYDEKIEDYANAFRIVSENLEKSIPINTPADERPVHIRASRARAFDICRCLIPSIAATNMVWYGSINEIRQHLASLERRFPDFVHDIIAALNEQFPETTPVKPVRFREPWAAQSPNDYYPIDTEIDFGSLRDFRRHRVGNHSLMRPYKTMHPWYLEMLAAHDIIVSGDIDDALRSKTTISSYHHPSLLGGVYDYTYTCDVEQAKYISALRSKLNVHPTVRAALHENWGNRPKLRELMDMTPDIGPFGYYVVRGNDTIGFKSET